MFLHGCLDHQDQTFSMGISCMPLAVWLGEDRKCSAAVVGLDLLLGLSI